MGISAGQARAARDAVLDAVHLALEAGGEPIRPLAVGAAVVAVAGRDSR